MPGEGAAAVSLILCSTASANSTSQSSTALISSCVTRPGRSKSGFAPQEVENAAAQAKEMGHVRVRGLMTIPPADATREENVVYFQKVQALYVDINRKMYDNGLEYLSMGMSGDFADAIRAGANMVRVGTAIFGARDYSK